MKLIKLAIILLIVIILAGFLGWHTYSLGCWAFVTPDSNRYPVWGIDVSHHQGTIDWNTVQKAGAGFAFIKATEGGSFVDPVFQANWRGAVAAGIPSAPYHYFTLCRSGTEQARHFLSQTSSISPTLPVVVDLEFVGNCSQRPSVNAFQKGLADFLDIVQDHFKRRAIFYTTYSFHKSYLSGAFPENGIWIRSIFSEPDPSTLPWTIWQYADHARVDGIQGPVDKNVWNPDVGM